MEHTFFDDFKPCIPLHNIFIYPRHLMFDLRRRQCTESSKTKETKFIIEIILSANFDYLHSSN